MPDPTKAIAHIRVSTSRQDLSPDAQRDAILAWAKREGVVVLAWHEDLAVSGGAELDKRPGLMAAIEAVKDADYLVVAKRDRLARDVLTAALVERLLASRRLRDFAKLVSWVKENEPEVVYITWPRRVEVERVTLAELPRGSFSELLEDVGS